MDSIEMEDSSDEEDIPLDSSRRMETQMRV